MTDEARVDNRDDGDATATATEDDDGGMAAVVAAATDDIREDGAEEEVCSSSALCKRGSSDLVSRYRILPKLRFRLSVRRRALENHWRSWGRESPVWAANASSSAEVGYGSAWFSLSQSLRSWVDVEENKRDMVYVSGAADVC